MARILVAWELGGGLGHLLPMRPLVRGLVERGHQVFVALRDLSRAGDLFGREGVSYLQAPVRLGHVAGPAAPARTFAHVLGGIGLSDTDGLQTLAGAWRNLYDYVRPEVLVADHSPTALLAARGLPLRRVVFGIPFACPPDEYPMRDLRPWLQSEPEELRRHEDRTLESVNRVVRSWGGSPLDRLTAIYHPADAIILTSLPELDFFGPRDGVDYWGAWPSEGGQQPEWPDAPGKRVFAYLKAFPARASLLALLAELRCSTLVYLDGDNPKLRRRFQATTLRFAQKRLDLSAICRECDLAILNAGSATTATMLLSGKPILQVPLYLEQMLNAATAARLGAALSARPTRPEQIAVRLTALLATAKYKEAAARFAERYAGFDPAPQIDKSLRRIDELVAA